MMELNRTTQSGNTAENIAGRDINIKTYNFEAIKVSYDKLSQLFAKIEEERKSNAPLNQFIEELERFTKPKSGVVKTLEQKLTEGEMQSFIEYALDAKETYSKFLMKHQFLKSAQEINVYLLALVRTYFNHQIYPVIQSGADQAAIGNLIVKNIVEPILAQLKEDTLGFTAEHIDGMLYFLTGNCYLEWK